MASEDTIELISSEDQIESTVTKVVDTVVSKYNEFRRKNNQSVRACRERQKKYLKELLDDRAQNMELTKQNNLLKEEIAYLRVQNEILSKELRLVKETNSFIVQSINMINKK
jgi:uncharacterized HAD superfamily protein